MTIASDIQELSQDAIVEMFEIDLTKHAQGIKRFTTTSVAGASIMFNGYEYIPAPVKVEGFQQTAAGSLPRPKLSIASGDPAFLSMVMGTDDLIGCEVRRIRTYRKYLDDGASPNPTAIFPTDVYVVNKKEAQKRDLFVFELAAKMDQEGRKVPALTVIRDTCTHRFRVWDGNDFDYSNATCPYAGLEMYDSQGNVTSNGAEAVCGRRLSDCVKHFGSDQVLPFRGFPGVGRSR